MVTSGPKPCITCTSVDNDVQPIASVTRTEYIPVTDASYVEFVAPGIGLPFKYH